jgi:hypothetical protein
MERFNPMQSTKLWYWEMKVASTGLWRQLSWRMTEKDAEAHAKSSGVELRKVEGSLQELQTVKV